MKLISHRGNITGRDCNLENKPSYIQNALNLGYDVEIDVRFNEKLYLGHDCIQYEIEEDFLLKKGLWCHAKTIRTFEKLLNLNIICFYHENDKCTLTSNGLIWTYPGNELTEKSICVLPEIFNQTKKDLTCYGICSDFIERYKI